MESIVEVAPLLVEAKFNINHKVRVSLTPRGLEVLHARIQEEDRVGASKATETINLLYRRGDDYVFQLYEFMALFGSSLPTVATSDAKYNLFEHNNITLLPDPYYVMSHRHDT